MTIGEYLKKEIEGQGRTQVWISEKIGLDKQSFNRKIKNSTFTADELIKISKLLNIDLNKMKEEL